LISYYLDDRLADDVLFDDILFDDALFDDIFFDDAFFEPPIYIPLYLAGFQDSSNLQAAVAPDPNFPDEFDAGTVYLYNDEPVFLVFGNIADIDVEVDEASDPFASVSGKCTRTDPNDELDDEYVGRAYCQFTYDFLDELGVSEGQLTAEGPVQIGDFAILSVTGGTNFFRKTVGQVHLWPSDNGSNGLPIEFLPELDLPASYFMEAYVFLESSLIPSDVIF
jgi:hypothetical protein